MTSYHLTLVRMAIVKKPTKNKCWRGCGKKETLYTVGGNVNWCSHYGEQYGGSLKKPKIELTFDTGIPFLGIYPEETIIPKDACTPMLTTALFTIARTQKQPTCPSTEEWMQKMWHIHTTAYHSAIKGNATVPSSEMWLGLKTVKQSEVSQKEKNIAY